MRLKKNKKNFSLKEAFSLSLSANLQLQMVLQIISVMLIVNLVVFFLMLWNRADQAYKVMSSYDSSIIKESSFVENGIGYQIFSEKDFENKNFVDKGFSPWNFYKDMRFVSLEEKGIKNSLENTYLVYSLGNNQYITSQIGSLILSLLQILPIVLLIESIILLISILLFSKKVKKSLEPIHLLAYRVHEVGGYDMDVRLAIPGTQRELVDLANEINMLLNRIQNAYSKQTQFVSDASHELRTPIAVIQGYADLLSRWGKDNPETLHESVEAIRNETRSMNFLVEQLLFLARGDQRNTKSDMKIMNMSDLMQEVFEEAEMVDDQHHFELSVEKDAYVRGDEALLKQLIRIFLENAIKYTPQNKTIKLSVSYYQDMVAFSVEDQGQGMPEQELPNIFERFYRIDKTRNRKAGGSGLGLAIADQILQIHNAKIEVTSQIGVGSKFKVFLKRIDV